jgi:hypothetical protein
MSLVNHTPTLLTAAAAGATVLIVAHASQRELQWVNKIIEIR